MRLFSLRATAIAVVALLGGCPTTVTCAAGEVFSGGMCVPGPGDSGVDAPTDAGPCGACDALTPYCDETMSPPTCVECLTAANCTAPDLACVDGSCEGCDGDEDCTDPGASTCDLTTYTCTSCSDPADCGHDGLGAICDTTGESGVCVECTAGDETACGTNVCDVEARTCTTTAAGSAGICMPCVSNRECAAGSTCVLQRFDEPPVDGTLIDVGYVCLPTTTGTCTSATAPFVQGEMLTDRMGDSVAVCGLSATTCPAYLDYRTTECVTDADCGVDGVMDSLCRSGSPDTTSGMACSTPCLGTSDCRSGAGCSTGVPGYCCFGASCT